MKKKLLFTTTVLCFICLTSIEISAQKFPSAEENIPYFITFGPKAETSWGDDDFSQTFFFLIPEAFTEPVYIRVFDPDCGGEIDELNGTFNTRMVFAVYGGTGCYSHPDAKGVDPVGEYKSGNLLATRTFGINPQTDNNWFTFGPFNPTEGEYVEMFGGYILKLIVDGVAGDDGNLYRFFLSTKPEENIEVEGGNAFAHEYAFRMHDDPTEVSHIYPYIDDATITLKQANFDWDSDGFIRTVSVARRGQMSKVSGEDNWVETEFKILEAEKNTSFDIQLIKRKSPVVKNNNVVIWVKNQRGESLPFVSIPIGGVPKFNYSISAEPID